MRIVPRRAPALLPCQPEHALKDAALEAVITENVHALGLVGESAPPLLLCHGSEAVGGGGLGGGDLDRGQLARGDC